MPATKFNIKESIRRIESLRVEPDEPQEPPELEELSFRPLAHGIADPQGLDLKPIDIRSKEILSIASQWGISIAEAGEVQKSGLLDKKQQPKEEGIGLWERLGKGFVSKAILQPLHTILSKGAPGKIDTLLRMHEAARKGETPLPELDMRTPFDIFRLSNLRKMREATAPFEAETAQQAAEEIGLDHFFVPPAETIAEKGIEIGTGVGAFVTKLALAKKVLGGEGLGADVMAFEFVHEVDGGSPGVGSLLGLSLGAFGKMPAATLTQKGLRVAGQSGTLAGYTAVSGGTAEDIAVAALLPPVMHTLHMFPAMLKGKKIDAKLTDDIRSRYPFMRDVARGVTLKWAAAMRDAVKVKAKQMTADAWGKKHGQNLSEFSRQAQDAFMKAGLRPELLGETAPTVKGKPTDIIKTYGPRLDNAIKRGDIPAAHAIMAQAVNDAQQVIPEKIAAEPELPEKAVEVPPDLAKELEPTKVAPEAAKEKTIAVIGAARERLARVKSQNPNMTHDQAIAKMKEEMADAQIELRDSVEPGDVIEATDGHRLVVEIRGGRKIIRGIDDNYEYSAFHDAGLEPDSTKPAMGQSVIQGAKITGEKLPTQTIADNVILDKKLARKARETEKAPEIAEKPPRPVTEAKEQWEMTKLAAPNIILRKTTADGRTTDTEMLSDSLGSLARQVHGNAGLRIQLADLPSAKTTPIQRATEGPVINAQVLRNIFETPTLMEKGFSSLSIPTRKMVLSSMNTLFQDDKVFRAIIQDVPIDMMNDLIGQQFSAKQLLGNKSMIINALSIADDRMVSRAMDSIISSLANLRAEVSLGSLDTKLISQETLSAIKAKHPNLHTLENIKEFIQSQEKWAQEAPKKPEKVLGEIDAEKFRRHMKWEEAMTKGEMAQLAEEPGEEPRFVSEIPERVLRQRRFRHLDLNIHEPLSPKPKAPDTALSEGPGKPPAPPLSDTWYEDNLEKYKKKRRSILERTQSFAARNFHILGRAVWSSSSRLNRISPELFRRTRRYAYDSMTRSTDMIAEVEDFVNALGKMSKADYAKWDLASKNADRKTMDALIKKYDYEGQFTKVRKILNEIYDAADTVGIEMNYVEAYWPRILKDPEGFLRYFQKGDDWSIIEEAIKRRAERAGIKVEDLSDEDKAQVINTLLRGYRTQQITLSIPGAAKAREIDVIDSELNKFYAKPQNALTSYIRTMNGAIAQREFFGKETREIMKLRAKQAARRTRLIKLQKRQGLKPGTTPEKYKTHLSKAMEAYEADEERLTRLTTRSPLDSVGGLVLDLVQSGEIEPTQEKEIRDILQGIFSPRGMGRTGALFSTAVYVDVLNSPIQALTQLDEFAYSLYKSPTKSIPTLVRTVARQSKVTPRDIGITSIGEEFRGASMQKALSTLLKTTGFERVDRLNKENRINTALAKYQAQAKKQTPPASFIRELERVFGPEHSEVLEDLRKPIKSIDDVSDNVKYLLFNDLLDVQPVAITEMPEYYNRAGSLRLAYMLKTFYLKRLNYIRDECFEDMKSPKTFHRGLGKMVWLASAFAFLGAGSDALKDWLKRRPPDFKDSVYDNLLRMVMSSKWQMIQIQKEGAGKAIGEQFVPPTKFADEFSKDMLTIAKKKERGFELWRSVPLVGELYYWWFGRGKEKTEARYPQLRWQRMSRAELKDEIRRIKPKGEQRKTMTAILNKKEPD